MNSDKMPAKGTAKMAPKNPHKAPPIAKDSKTKTGDKPINLLERNGVENVILSADLAG